MGSIYLGYTSGTAIASGSNIPMTQIIRRECSDIGTSLVLHKKGYYIVDVDVQMTSTAGGNATVTLYQDNVAVTNATATQTIAATGQSHIHFTCIVRNNCCSTSTLTLGYSGAVLTSTYASMVIRDA